MVRVLFDFREVSGWARAVRFCCVANIGSAICCEWRVWYALVRFPMGFGLLVGVLGYVGVLVFE